MSRPNLICFYRLLVLLFAVHAVTADFFDYLHSRESLTPGISPSFEKPFTRIASFYSGYGRDIYGKGNSMEEAGMCPEFKRAKEEGGPPLGHLITFVPKSFDDFMKLSLNDHGIRGYEDLFTLSADFDPKKLFTKPETPENVWTQIKENLEKKMPKCWRRPGYCGNCEKHGDNREACLAKVFDGKPQGCEYHEELFLFKNDDFIPLREKVSIYENNIIKFVGPTIIKERSSNIRVSVESSSPDPMSLFDDSYFKVVEEKDIRVSSSEGLSLKDARQLSQSLKFNPDSNTCPLAEIEGKDPFLAHALPQVHVDYVDPVNALLYELSLGGDPSERKIKDIKTGANFYAKEMFNVWFPYVQPLKVHPLSFRINKDDGKFNILNKEGRHECPPEFDFDIHTFESLTEEISKKLEDIFRISGSHFSYSDEGEKKRFQIYHSLLALKKMPDVDGFRTRGHKTIQWIRKVVTEGTPKPVASASAEPEPESDFHGDFDGDAAKPVALAEPEPEPEPDVDSHHGALRGSDLIKFNDIINSLERTFSSYCDEYQKYKKYQENFSDGFEFWFTKDFSTIGQAIVFETARVQHTSLANSRIIPWELTEETNCRITQENRFIVGVKEMSRKYPDPNDPDEKDLEGLNFDCEEDLPNVTRDVDFPGFSGEDEEKKEEEKLVEDLSEEEEEEEEDEEDEEDEEYLAEDLVEDLVGELVGELVEELAEEEQQEEKKA